MSFEVEVRSPASRPDMRVFILHGLPSVNQHVEIQLNDSGRESAAKEAEKKGFPIGAFLIKQPHFSYIRARNVNNVPCIDVMIRDGEMWERMVGTKTTIETSTKKYLEMALKDAPKLVGDAGSSQNQNLETLKKELSAFIQNHSLQKTIKADEGSMMLTAFNSATKQAVILSEGSCASNSTCKGPAGTSVSENKLRNDILIRFPGTVYDVVFEARKPS